MSKRTNNRGGRNNAFPKRVVSVLAPGVPLSRPPFFTTRSRRERGIPCLVWPLSLFFHFPCSHHLFFSHHSWYDYYYYCCCYYYYYSSSSPTSCWNRNSHVLCGHHWRKIQEAETETERSDRGMYRTIAMTADVCCQILPQLPHTYAHAVYKDA